MSKRALLNKNIQLSRKVAEYLIDHPAMGGSFPDNASFVVFSRNDTDLNEVNERILHSVVKEGRPVIKVEETNSKSKPWRFTSFSL